MGYGLYVHVPFCNNKCKYCDFLSFQGMDNGLKLRYAKALAKEITVLREQFSYQPDTIYIGGGTPTALETQALEIILQSLMPLASYAKEYTIEANPETINETVAELCVKYGINRVSLGAQSADDGLLKSLGRNHTFTQTKAAVNLLRAKGIENINLDLMYALPGQTLQQWEETLEQVLALQTEHISMYQLKIEEGTAFYHQMQQGNLAEIDQDLAADMYLLGQKMLNAAGFIQYELSNYAKDGFESKHNLLYWRSMEYLAAGLGATGLYQGRRRVNENNLAKYLSLAEAGKLSLKEETILSKNDQMSEMVFMGLRLKEGVSLQRFYERFSVKLTDVYGAAVEKCCALGLLEDKEARIVLTDKGKMLGDYVFMEFID